MTAEIVTKESAITEAADCLARSSRIRISELPDVTAALAMQGIGYALMAIYYHMGEIRHQLEVLNNYNINGHRRL